MKSQVVTQVVDWAGYYLDINAWFGDPYFEYDEKIINLFMRLAIDTWNWVNGMEFLVMTLDGDTMRLYFFAENRKHLDDFILRFREYSDDFNRTVGSGRDN